MMFSVNELGQFVTEPGTETIFYSDFSKRSIFVDDSNKICFEV